MTDTPFQTSGYVRLKQILRPYGPVSVSRISRCGGVRSGRYPCAVELGPRTNAWVTRDILAPLATGTE